MPLTSFGAILSFAEEMESRDRDFYLALAENPNCARYREFLRRLADEAAKRVKTAQRIRRENVTEMILEPIKDFERRPFTAECGNPAAMNAGDAIEACRELEERAARYYREAAVKIKALPEAATGLRHLGAKRTACLNLLGGLAGQG
jgi:rubrerythrin